MERRLNRRSMERRGLEVQERTDRNTYDGQRPQVGQQLAGDLVHVNLSKVGSPDVLGVGGVAAALDTLSSQELP